MNKNDEETDTFREKTWTIVQENLLKDWAEKARYYSWMHNKTHQYYSQLDSRLTIPLICVSTISGSANFTMVGNQSSSTFNLVVFPLSMGILSMVAAILSATGKYMKSSELAAKHLLYHKNYNALFRNISLELSISPDQRRYAYLSMNEYRNDMDRLMAESPTIPDSVITQFNLSFPYVRNKPEIAHNFEKIIIYGRLELLKSKEEMMRKVRTFYKLKLNQALTKLNKKLPQQTENKEDKVKPLYCDYV
jgi:hypothetical protein